MGELKQSGAIRAVRGSCKYDFSKNRLTMNPQSIHTRYKHYFLPTNNVLPPERPFQSLGGSPRRLEVHGIASDLPAEADPAFAGEFLHHLDRHGGIDGP